MAEPVLDLWALERAHLPCPHAAGDGPDPDCTLCALAAVLGALRRTRAVLREAIHWTVEHAPVDEEAETVLAQVRDAP